MIHLHEIDSARASQVLEGKISFRGCGLTTSRMLQLFSRLQKHNHGKRYLFVGENQQHLIDIYRTFYYWAHDSGYHCSHESISMSLTVVSLKPPKAIKFVDKVVEFLSPPWTQTKISFQFTTPEKLATRGVSYHDIIEDLTWKKEYANCEILAEARQRIIR